MNDFGQYAAGESSWHNNSTATIPPSLIQNGAGMDSVSLDWFLSQMPSQAEELGDEQGWIDIAKSNPYMQAGTGQSMERRNSISNSSLWDGSTRSAYGSKTRGGKRRRVQRSTVPHTVTSSGKSITYQARQRALEEISTSGWNGGCLEGVCDFECEDRHCFAMGPMGENPLGYAGEQLRYEKLEICVIEPPVTSRHLHLADYPAQSLPISRPVGKSLHIIIAKCPRMADPRSLESGFALLIVCHKFEDNDTWSPFCITSFIESKQSAKTTSDAAHFVANLDRCTKAENGKRIWGERTSHVKHESCLAKPLRIEPRGPGATFAKGQQYCVVITLHDMEGKMLFDDDGTACIAQSNPFLFTTIQDKPKQLASQSRDLLDQFEKLSISQKVLLATSSSSSYARNVLLSNSHDTQRSAGAFICTNDSKLPSSACPLSDFHKDPSLPHSSVYLLRLQAVASFFGHRHANVDLTDQNLRYLRTFNTAGAEGRFMKLSSGGQIDQNQEWLRSNGISLDIIAVYNRVQILASIMHTRDYRSQWAICVTNVYPAEVMVDRDDATKVHCLVDRAGQETLDLADRIYPLARLAFCSKIPRSLIEQNLLLPYIKAFQEAGGNGTSEEALHEEKFWLILQGIFLDYFLYWTELRSAEACKRIQDRLLEDDHLLDEKFFGHDKMHRFSFV